MTMMSMTEICFKREEVPVKDICELVTENPGVLMPQFSEKETLQEGALCTITCVFTNPRMQDILQEELEARYPGKVSFR